MKNTHQIFSEIEGLVREYEDAARREAQGMLRSELLRAACQNKAGWSGGFSTRNLTEQVQREVALDLLDQNHHWEMVVADRPEQLNRAIRYVWGRICDDMSIDGENVDWTKGTAKRVLKVYKITRPQDCKIDTAAHQVVIDGSIHDDLWHQVLGEPVTDEQKAEHMKDRFDTATEALIGQPGITKEES